MHIPLDRQSKVPLYRQIEKYLRAHIQAGQLAPNLRLPATRQLAEMLGVSRITVQNAYVSLESEGYITSREGSGAYVALRPALEKEDAFSADFEWPLWQQNFEQNAPKHPSFSTSPLLDKNSPEVIAFTGVGDPQYFPAKDFQKSLRTVIQNTGAPALEYGPFGAGYYPLRATIAHILASQGVQTHPDRVLITSGSQQALGAGLSIVA